MPTYVAFLRAINLGARRKFGKDDLRRVIEEVGFADVETYINTGNVVFSTPLRSRARIEERLEAAFAADRGFEVPTIVYAADELARVRRDIDELGAGHPDLRRHYVVLLKDEPSAQTVAAVEASGTAEHRVVVRHRVAHLLLGPGYQDGQTDPTRAERHLGVVSSRTARVVGVMADKAAARSAT